MNKVSIPCELEIVLKKMCEFVDANYDTIDFSNQSDPYYMKYSWDTNEEDKFKEWMVTYLLKNKKARNVFLDRLYINKEIIKKAVNEFALFYGWKYK